MVNATLDETGNSVNRRRHDRFVLQPMYTALRARLLEEPSFTLEGHAYDISEGGVQFELDRAFGVGTEIALEILLPDPRFSEAARAVLARGTVIWTDDDGVEGPVRMAVAFTGFAREGDREQLLRHFTSGRYARAA